MLAAALEDEVAAYIGRTPASWTNRVGSSWSATGMRPRQVTTAAGAVDVLAGRVDDRRIDEGSGGRSA
jgi:putative transposase